MQHLSFSFSYCCLSSVLISEAPLLCHLSWHPYLQPHPRLILHYSPAPRGPQEEESYLVGCHPKDTLHCCRVTLAVFSNACSDLAYTGHPLLCPLLTTVLAKLYNQTDWASSPESRLPPCPSSILWCVARKEAGTLRLGSPQEHGRKGHIRHFCLLHNEDEDDNWWCYGCLFWVETWLHTDRANCHIYPGLNQVWELQYLQCWSSI